MVMSPAGVGTKNGCAGKGHKKFIRPKRKKIARKSKHRGEVTIEPDLREIGWGVRDWINMD
jgi:hypothetical protein